MRVRSANASRTAGTKFGSGAPPVAQSCTNRRAASQFNGPWPCSGLARSPNIGICEKKSSGRSSGVSSAMTSMLGRYLVRVATAEVLSPQRVHITGAEGSLARRVLALLADDPGVVDGSATASDVVIHLGSQDHDRRARRRENLTDGAAVMLADATAGEATHLVLVT